MDNWPCEEMASGATEEQSAHAGAFHVMFVVSFTCTQLEERLDGEQSSQGYREGGVRGIRCCQGKSWNR